MAEGGQRWPGVAACAKQPRYAEGFRKQEVKVAVAVEVADDGSRATAEDSRGLAETDWCCELAVAVAEENSDSSALNRRQGKVEVAIPIEISEGDGAGLCPKPATTAPGKVPVAPAWKVPSPLPR